ncbi:type VI secretion system baseplate subunit TssG [Gynuella sp.]|uniref:type VI secretion system baseplate subunit TssG n=1 Tax=Gynuella sp. TaxID=2969146 RepID=UPI003D0FD822
MAAIVRSSGTTPVDLYQLVRDCLPKTVSTTQQVLDTLGEHVRFRGYLGFEHPYHEVAKVDTRTQPVQVYLNRFAVSGLMGPLPEPYFQWCYERVRAGDFAMAAFFDMFTHRINALRYLSRARRQPGLSPLRPEHSVPGKLLSAYAGMIDQRRTVVEDSPVTGRLLLGLAGLLIYAPRSLSLLQLILQRILNWRLQVDGFRGGWLNVDSAQQVALGRRNSTLSMRAAHTTQLGSRVWDQHLGLRLRVWMEHPDACVDYLPDGKRHEWLSQLLRMLTYCRHDIEVCFLFPHSWRSRRLGSDGIRLAYSSWLQYEDRDTAPQWTIRLRIPAQPGGQYEAW